MAAMSVAVRLSGPLAARLGPRRRVELAAGATAADLVAELGRQAGLEPGELRGLAVVAGGAFLAREHMLADGLEVHVLVPVAGG
jgi:sulfur carrier protein ThiS